MFGSTEIAIIVIIVFILFGASALPKFAKSIGQAKKEFEKGLKDGDQADKNKKKTSSKTEK